MSKEAALTQPVFRDIEQQNRLAALENAVRHRIKDEDGDAVVKTAQKYYDFLQQGPSTPAAAK